MKAYFQTKSGEKEFDAGKAFATEYAARVLNTVGVPVELRNENGEPILFDHRHIEENGDFVVRIAFPNGKKVQFDLDREWHAKVAFRVFAEATLLPVCARIGKGKILKANLDNLQKPAPEKNEEHFIGAAHLWIDGSCSKNPGPGGWGVCGTIGDKPFEIYGSEASTTNNRMELMAAIQALRAARKAGASPIYVTSDSNLVVRGINEWITKWIDSNWTKSDKKPVENRDLWEQILEMNNEDVMFIKTKGHSDDPNNNRADALAKRGTEESKTALAKQQPVET